MRLLILLAYLDLIILMKFPFDDWNKILNINLTGTFFMCSHAIPMLLESKGAIVNVSSTAALGAHAWTPRIVLLREG